MASEELKSPDTISPDKPSEKEPGIQDESTITIDELLDIVHEATTTDVGRVVALSLLGMKRENSQEELRLSDVLNTLTVLPKMTQSKKLSLDVVADLLKGKIDLVTEGKNSIQLDKEAIWKINHVIRPISAQRKRSHDVVMESPIYKASLKRAAIDSVADSFGFPVEEDGLSACDVTQEQLSDRSDIVESERIEKRERGASEQVEISDLIGALLSVSDREERKQLTKTIVIGVLQQPLGTLDAMVDHGKTKIQKQELFVKKTIKQTKPKTQAADRLVTMLHTPLRNCLAPGISGERLVHTVELKRPRPAYRGIERSASQRVVGALPERLNFATVSHEWGQSSYGILKVTWTNLSPKYAINEEAEPGRLHIKNIHTPAINDKDHGNVKKAQHGYHNVNRANLTKKSTVPAVFRDRLKDASIAIPYLGLPDVHNKSISNKGTPSKSFCIDDTYQIPPIKSSDFAEHTRHRVLPSLSNGNKPYSYISHDELLSHLTEVHLPSITNVQNKRNEMK
ncbi:uncharacterized protein LOC114574508 [Exaiptasia diaphana]|uniref:Uncharacterized protein n=1 Tax=Exaiptasia diaphana TaxID=2652724 RepID=A0A913YCQ1_EXADI|nr:uncharacterized protein LOC114574508 [Exaiptasia diaphana]KXJ18050.1 hypothetical protein AC249_AIPGENE21455 [Exaiptasia diaphana]